MPRDHSRCWFFTATSNLSLTSSQVGDDFRRLIDEARPSRCSGGLDIIAFSYEENQQHGAIISGFVHSTLEIRRVTVEEWIKDQRIVMEGTSVHGHLHQAPMIRKFLDESDESGIDAGLKRRVNYLGNCTSALKKPGITHIIKQNIQKFD